MNHLRERGFTLIELLTVIAIIAILASMVFIVGPKAIERAKLAKLGNVFGQVRTEATAYLTSSGSGDSYPPRYGYKQRNVPEGTTEQSELYNLKPYVAYIKRARKYDIYDLFGRETHDTDKDGEISLLEFSPYGSQSGPFDIQYPDTLYDGANLGGEVSTQMGKQRPLAYIPVDSKQAKKVAQYFYLVAEEVNVEEGFYALRWRPTETFAGRSNPIAGLKFPPPRYDDFVLISMGPMENTGGILAEDPDFMADLAGITDGGDIYHILALRAYFLATRDVNANGLPDFDFNARTKKKEADPDSYPGDAEGLVDYPGYEYGLLNLLPDGTNGGGPVIYRPTGG
ncbi:MAG: prepilin-type N-terminal cleavage/methylation domain-containing protein [Nitrospiraceae bacterium]|nr:prepilin-type N-terminal cleavage/methylation domain-containing protein [Nitrospiraceae bacterium]